MISRHLVPVLLAGLALSACGSPEKESAGAAGDGDSTNSAICPAANDAGVIRIAPGLTAKVLRNGHGRAAVVGDYADTNVRLWLYDESTADGRGQSIWESGDDVFQFQLGRGQVIKGWDLGIPCMLEGETRELIISGDLAYGATGRGEIPPNATLIFTIELVKLTASE